MLTKAPKIGCEILCAIASDLRVFSVRRPRFRAEWRITSDNGTTLAEVLEWSEVIAFFEKINAADFEVSEYQV